MTRFEKWSVLISALLVSLTGIGYLWVKYAMRPAETWDVINHPLQPWLLKSHIVFAPLLVFAVGMIAVRHVWRHYRSGMRWGRKSGILAALSLVPMILSGYLVQGITHEGWLRFVAVTHIVSSLVFTIALVIHAVLLARLLTRARLGMDDDLASPPDGPRSRGRQARVRQRV